MDMDADWNSTYLDGISDDESAINIAEHLTVENRDPMWPPLNEDSNPNQPEILNFNDFNFNDDCIMKDA